MTWLPRNAFITSINALRERRNHQKKSNEHNSCWQVATRLYRVTPYRLCPSCIFDQAEPLRGLRTGIGLLTENRS